MSISQALLFTYSSTSSGPSNLLMHFDGANNSTTFTDSSGFGHTFTNSGPAIISTTQSKFGGSSIYFNEAHLLGDASSDFAFGTGDFTIDLWYRFAAALPGYTLLFDTRDSPSANGVWMEYNGGWRTGFGSTVLITESTALTNTWYHLAVTRAGGIWRLFVDGVSTVTANNSRSLVNPANRPVINTQGDGVGFGRAICYMDELRVLKGTAAWTSNFTPPTSAYT